MPLKIQDPRPGRSPYYSIRGTHRGVNVNRSAQTRSRDEAKRVLKIIEDDIDRAFFAGEIGAGWRPGDVKPDPLDKLFMVAAAEYMAAGGPDDHLDPIIDALGDKTLAEIDQSIIDATALSLFPSGTAATRNRWFYTPVSAILKQAGDTRSLKRPKGWRGTPRVHWMTPDQATRVLAAAHDDDIEFGQFLTVLLYTGMRLSEALALTLDRLDISESWAWTPETKNGQPRLVHLPPAAVAALANHPRGLDRGHDDKVFRFTKCGRLYTRIKRVTKAAGPDCGFVTFHIFRHTWATWMRRYGDLDTRGLVDTGAWRSIQSAAVYEHVIASEEARRADKLPDVTRNPESENRGKSVESRQKKA